MDEQPTQAPAQPEPPTEPQTPQPPQPPAPEQDVWTQGPGTSDPSPSDMTVGATLSKAWEIFSNNFALYAGLGVLPALLTLLGSLAFTADTSVSNSFLDDADPIFNVVSFGSFGILALVVLLVNLIVQVAMYRSALREVRGERDITFSGAFSDGMGYLGQFVLVSLAVGVIVIIGLVAFILPGLYFLVRYGLAPLVAVDDRAPRGLSNAMNEAKRLIKGNLGYLVVLSLAWLGIAVVLGFASIFLGDFSVIVDALLTAFYSVAVMIAYENIRVKQSTVAPAPVSEE